MVHKKADKILHLTFPPLPDRPLFKVLQTVWMSEWLKVST